MSHSANSDQRPGLTIAMIVRDAAAALEQTLDCVRGIADEIVVGDTGSVDGTLEIARTSADIALQLEWHDDFAAARNECLRHVHGDWVLWVEAGESLDDTAAQQLRKFVDDSADRNKAYMLFIRRPAASSAQSIDQIGQLRLLPNRPEVQFAGRVREKTLRSLLDAKMGIDALDCYVNVAAVDSNAERLQARRVLNLANLSLTEQAEQAAPLLARAEALAQLGRPVESAEAYRQALEAAERGSSEMLEAYYGILSGMDIDPSAAEEQIATCLRALEIYPLDSQLLCGMGSYLLRAKRLDLAARAYETAVRYGKVDPSLWHLADLADVAVSCWSLVLQLQGDLSAAETVLREALTDRPDSVRMRRQLIDLCIKSGRQREALGQCHELPDDLPGRSQLSTVVAGAALVAANRAEQGLKALRQAYQAGCRDLLCLRWLAMANLAVGNMAELESVAAEWQRHEPANLEIAAFRQAAQKQATNALAPNRTRRVDSASRHILPIHASSGTPDTVSPEN